MQNQDCTRIREYFTEYQDNTLTSEARAGVDAHLTVCSSCRSTYHELRGIIHTLHSLPQVKSSDMFTENLLSRIEALDNQSMWHKVYHSSYMRIAGFAVAAGLVVALGLNVLLDPIAPLNSPGTPQKYAGETNPQNAPESAFTDASIDSAQGLANDSLTIQNAPIRSENQSLFLVSGKK